MAKDGALARGNERKRRAKQENRKKARAARLKPSQSDESSDTQITLWLVSFLDILGYRELLKGLDQFPFVITPENKKLMTAAFAKAVHFRRRFVASVESFLSSTAGDLSAFVGLPAEAVRTAERWTSVRIHKSPGADHFILGASLAPTENHFPLRAVYSIFGCSAAVMLNQLAIGGDSQDQTLPIRGAIDIAAGAVMQPDDMLFSPGVVRAYELETKAKYPRVVIGERVVQFLETMTRQPPPGLEGEYISKMAARCQAMLTRDADGVMILDFFGETIRDTVSGEGPVGVQATRIIGRRAWRYAQSALPAAERRGDEHVISKYRWLVDYMRPRAHLWE